MNYLAFCLYDFTIIRTLQTKFNQINKFDGHWKYFRFFFGGAPTVHTFYSSHTFHPFLGVDTVQTIGMVPVENEGPFLLVPGVAEHFQGGSLDRKVDIVPFA